MVILMVLALRHVVPPKKQETCYYNARALPSAGGIPFLQSLICNIDNDCNNASHYEEIPSYRGSKVDELVHQVAPLMSDNDIISLVKALPKGVNLMRAVIDTLAIPSIQEILEKGLPLHRFLKDPNVIKDLLQNEAKINSPAVAEALTHANISIHKLLEIVGMPVNLTSMVCNPNFLKNYLVLKDGRSLKEISNVLCALDGPGLSRLVDKLQSEVDSGKIIKMISDLMSQFGRPDVGRMLDDIGTMIDTIFSLPSVVFSNNSKVSNATKWLPRLKSLVEPLKVGDVNLGLIGEISADIEPFFEGSRNGRQIQSLLKYVSTISSLIRKGLQTLPEANPKLKSFFNDPEHMKAHFTKTFHPAVVDAILESRLQREKESYRNMALRKPFQTFCEEPGLVHLFDYGTTFKTWDELQSFQDSLCILFLNGTSMDLVKPGPPEDDDHKTVESRVLLVNNTSEVLGIVKSLEKELIGFRLEYLLLVQNLVDSIIATLSTQGFDGIKLGNVVDSIMNIMEQTHYWPKIRLGHAVFYHMFNITLDLLETEMSTSHDKGLDVFWPYMAESILMTLSDTQKWPKMLNLSAWPEVTCNPQLFVDAFAIPGGVDTMALQEFACSFLGTVHILIDEAVRNNYTRPKDLDWSMVMVKLEKIYRLARRNSNEDSFVDAYNWKRLETSFDNFHHEVWGKHGPDGKTNVIVNSMKQFSDWLTYAKFKYINDFKALFFALHKMLTLVNDQFRSVIAENSIRSKHFGFNLPTLTQIVYEMASILPDLIRTGVRLIANPTPTMLRMGLAREYLSKVPCIRGSITEFIDFKNKTHMQNLEKFLCRSSQGLAQETLSDPHIGLMLSAIHNVSIGETLNFSWKEVEDNLVHLQHNVVTLSKFNGTVFPEVVNFNLTDVKQALNESVEMFKLINGSYHDRKFLFALADTALQLFDNTSQVRKPTFATLKWNSKKVPDVFGNLVVTSKFAFWTGNEMLDEITKYMVKLQKSELSMYDLLNTSLLRDLWELLMNFPYLTEVFIKSLLNPAFSDVIEDFIQDKHLSTVCASYAAFEQVMQFGEERKDLGETFFIIMCQLGKDTWQEAFQQLWRGSAFTGFIERVSKAWYSSNPTTVPVRLLSFFDKVNRMTDIITEVVENPPRFIWGGEKTILKAKIWEKFANSTLKLMKDSSTQRFTIAVQPLVQLLENLSKTSKLNLTKELDKGSIFLDQLAHGLVKLKENKTLTLKELMPEASKVSSLMNWAEQYLVDGSEAIMYTLALDSRKFTQFLRLNRTVKDIVCNQPANTYLITPPHVTDRKRFEEGKAILCKNQWFNSTTINVHRQTEAYVPRAKPRHFLNNLGRVLDLLVNEGAEDATFLSRASPLLTSETWSPVIGRFYKYFDLNLSDPAAWVNPISEKMLTAIGENAIMVKFFNDMMTSVSCTLNKVQGGIRWNYIEMIRDGDRTNFMAFVKMLNDSVDFVQLALNTLQQPPLLQNIMEDFVVLKEKKNAFCAVPEHRWNRYFVIKNQDELTSVRSLQSLVCNTNYTAALIEMNPAYLCQVKSGHTPTAKLSVATVSRSMMDLYLNITNVISKRYNKDDDQTEPITKFSLPWRNATRWHNIFKTFAENVDQSFKNFTIRSFSEWLSVVGIMFEEYPNSWVSFQFFHESVRAFVKTIEPLMTEPPTPITLDKAFAKSPYLRQVMKSWLPNLPTLVETIMWSMMAPSQILPLLTNRGGPVKPSVCRNSVREYFYNPRLKDEDWESLQHMLCNISYNTLLQESKQLMIINIPILRQTSAPRPLNWKTMSKDVSRLIEFLQRLVVDQPIEDPKAPPTTWSDPEALTDWKRNMTGRDSQTTVPVFLTLNSVTHYVRSLLGTSDGCRRNSSLSTEFGLHPDLFEMVCTTGQEGLTKDGFDRVRVVLDVVDKAGNGSHLDFPVFYRAVLEATEFKDLVRGISGNKTADQWSNSEVEYLDFLDRIRGTLSRKDGDMDRLKVFPKSLKGIGPFLLNVTGIVPVLNTFSPIINYLADGIKALNRTVQIEEVLSGALPDSPVTRNIFETIIHQSHDILPTLMWTSLLPEKVEKLTRNSHYQGYEVLHYLCNSSLSDFLYNPAFNSRDWARIQSSICSYNLTQAWLEIRSLIDISSMRTLVHSPLSNPFEVFGDSFVKLMSAVSQQDQLQRLETKFLEMSRLAQEPEVMTYVVYHNTFRRFCEFTPIQFRNLPHRQNKEAIQNTLCYLSSQDFAAHVGSNVGKLLILSSRRGANNQAMEWREMYHSITEVLGYQGVLRIVSGDEHYSHVRRLQTNYMRLVTYRPGDSGRTLPIAVQEMQPVLLKSSRGRKILHYFSFVFNYLKPTVSRRILSRPGELSFRVLVQSQIEASFNIRQLLNSENFAIDSIMDMTMAPERVLEAMFENPSQVFCRGLMSEWAKVSNKSTLTIRDIEDLLCSEDGKILVTRLVQRINVDKLMAAEGTGLQWSDVFEGYFQMQQVAANAASDLVNNQWHLVDRFKLDRFVQNVLKASNILNAYKVSDAMVNVLRFIDKFGKYSDEWQTGMGFFRAILDATNYFLLSDSNKDIYSIISNGTNLGEFFKRVLGSQQESPHSLSSRQVLHAVDVMAGYYDANKDDLDAVCKEASSKKENSSEVAEIVLLFCKYPASSWPAELKTFYRFDKSGSYIKHALTAVARLVMASDASTQNRIRFWLHKSNVDDLVPMIQNLISKFVKAPGGLYRLEGQLLKPIPMAIWEAVPSLFKAQNDLWCLHDNISLPVLTASNFAHILISKVPDPEMIFCETPTWSFAKLYHWTSKNFEFKKLSRLAQQMMLKRYDPNLKCVTPLGVISDGMNLVSQISRAMNDPKRYSVIKECVHEFHNTTLVDNLNKYGDFLKNVTGLLEEFNLSATKNLSSINEMWTAVSDFISGQLPVFHSVSDIIWNIRGLEQMLRSPKSNMTEDTVKALLNASLNLNWLARKNFSKEAVTKAVCEKHNLRPVLRIPSLSFAKKAIIINALCKKGGISIILDAMDSARILREIPKLQHQELLKGDWLEQLVNNIQSIMNHFLDLASVGGKLLNKFSTGITSELLTSVVQILRENTVDKLLTSLQGLLEKIEPAIEGSRIAEDLSLVLQGMRSLKSLQGLNLFNVQYRLQDLFGDSGTVKVGDFLREELDLAESAVSEILEGQIDLTKVLSSKNLVESVQNIMCNPQELKQLLRINSPDVTVENITHALCSLSSGQALKVSSQLLNQLALSKIIENFVEVGINGVLGKVNLTWTEALQAFNALKTTPSVMPKLRKYTGVVTNALDPAIQNQIKQLNISTEGIRLLGTPAALNAFGKLLCGKTLKALNQELELLQISHKEPTLDNQEIEDLPSQFCRTGYEQVMRMNGGPILWGFLKPILRGRILYAPKNKVTHEVFKQVNKTFENFSGFITALQAWGEGIAGLHYLQERSDLLDKMKELLGSPAVQPILKQVVGDDATSILDQFNISSINGQLKNVSGLLDLMQLVGNMSQCFELNRFHGFDTEEEVELMAQKLSVKREFIAGMIFLDEDDGIEARFRTKRSDDDNGGLPKHIKYKIRMDIDNVPTTQRKKMQFWQPGPRDDFLDDMRYFRGFLQYQEMIDNAILHVQTKGQVTIRPTTYLQQFPYPCYHQDRFGVFLKGMLPIIISVCWLFLVAFLIREYVIEKELQLDEVLRVMGLKQWVGWLAWYISGLCILSIGVGFCVFILKVGGIFPYSNGLIIFLYLMEFALLVIMYCYLMSAFFRTATIAALTGIIIYLLTFLPFVVIVSLDSQLSLYQKLFTSLLMCTSFCYGCLHINRYEAHGVGIQWENLMHSPVHDDEMNFVYSVIMVAVDIILYAILGWYISNVWPHNSARKRPWYFPFTLSYWGIRKKKFNYYQLPDSGKNVGYFFGEDVKGHEQEDIAPNAEQQTVGISLRGLSVVYNRGKPMERVAVSNLSLDFMEGHITTLLGQNGAGKTTTINVLTGQYPPTSGSVYVYGKNIPHEFNEIQKILGYCPQYNTLFARMTVREHLKFYAQLKGVLSGRQLEEDVDEMLDSMGLTHKQHEQSQYLSGGMQRRLCVSLAFIGGSKVIILDEPTSSVDPVARRSIWDLIVKYRHGRTILLTTHHMDEADILSDKVAIIHKGKLLCHGSPLLLKSKFGCGYQLILARPGEAPEHDSDSGRASSACSSESDHSESEDILTFIQAHVPLARLMEDNGTEVVISLPQRDSEGRVYAFGNLFKQLDASITTLGYLSYGITSTTLEEVFLTLCGLDDNTVLPVSHSEPLPMRRNSIVKPSPDELDKVVRMNEKNAVSNDYSYVNGAYIGSALDFGCKEPIRGYKLKLHQFHALLLKRYYHFLHDWRAISTSILLPCAFIAIAMGFSLIKPAGQGAKEPSILLSPPMYGPNAMSFYSYNGKSDTDLAKTLNRMIAKPGLSNACMKTATPEEKLWCHRNMTESPDHALLSGGGLCFDEEEALRIKHSKNFYQDLPFVPTDTGDYVYNLTGHDLNRYLLDTYIANTERRYGGFTFVKGRGGTNVVKVWYDNSGFHSSPAYVNSLSNALLRANMKELGVDPSVYGITVYNQPLQVTSEQLGRATILTKTAELGISLVIFLGFAFIPTSFVVYIVKERIQEEKRLQYVAGVGPLLYWFTAFVWDLVLVIIAVGISTVIILMFGLPIYVDRLNLAGIFVLLLLFGWSTTPLMYLLEKLFNEASIAFMVLYCLNIFVGVSIMVGTLVLGIFSFGSVTKYWLNFIENIALVAPQYALMGGLVSMAQNHIQAEVFAIFGQDTYESPFSWNVILPHIIAMAVEGLVLFLLNLILEIQWASCLPAPKYNGELPQDDSDVAEERKRIESEASKNDVLKIKNMRKAFKGMAGEHIAVDNVTFGIPKGECFGLLGVNGAGKTTLFRILTGHITSTTGQAFIGGQKISKVLSNNSELLGYCPQADALDDLLTPEQHFIIYGKLRGIPKKDLKMVVKKAMAKFELKIYTNRHVGTLSRGTKRKVCTAISMLGNPQIVLLDEPTTGMDPVTRRLVWNNVLQTVKDQRSVLLTSHSMEECDVLCSRLAIMVNGRIRCLGSPQLLKYKFGTGYTITLRIMDSVEDLSLITDFMANFFPSAILRAHHYNMIEFSLPEKNIPLYDIFGHLEQNQEKLGIKDFSISQTTLDQVFVSFARQQGDEAGNVKLSRKISSSAINEAYIGDEQTHIKLDNLNNSTLERELKEDPDEITLYVDENDVEATKF